MTRRSVQLDGTSTHEAAIAAVLRAARVMRFNAALSDYGIQGNPYSLRPLAARIGVHVSTLHGWESGKGRPESFASYRRWMHALGKNFGITIDGEEVET